MKRGRYVRTTEMRKKASESRLGKKHTFEQRERQRGGMSSAPTREFTCTRCGVTKTCSGVGRLREFCQECLETPLTCLCGCGGTVLAQYENKGYIRGHISRVECHFPVTFGDDNPSRRLEVRLKLSQIRMGENNPNWNSEWSDELYIPYQRAFQKAKQVVWERDRGTCQIPSCGLVYNPGLKLRTHVVHHIDEDPSHNDTVNLVLLCRSCHRLVHSGKVSLPSRVYEDETTQSERDLSNVLR